MLNTVLIRYRGLRRVLGVILVVLGALLMWLAPEAWSGVVLLAAGIALEAAGITLEHRAARHGNRGNRTRDLTT